MPRPLLAVKVNIGIPFHDLCDASSQVLQQAHKVIYLISLHQSNALALIELSYAIQEHIYKLFLFESLIGVDVLCLFPCEGHEVILTMIALHGDLQEERIGHLWCCDVVHGINTECIQCRISEVLEYISHESHIEYIVQFVVLTPCLDIKCALQFDQMIIFTIGHNLTLHIINALFARGNDGVIQCVVGFNETVEHGFLPCQQIDILVTPLFAL